MIRVATVSTLVKAFVSTACSGCPSSVCLGRINMGKTGREKKMYQYEEERTECNKSVCLRGITMGKTERNLKKKQMYHDKEEKNRM